MKLAIATYGTEGDARPFAALARGLLDAGHQVQLLADAATLGTARALEVQTVALAGDIRGVLASEAGIGRVVAKGAGFNDTARALASIANENTDSWLDAIVHVAVGCDAILVAGLAAYAGLSAAEVVGAIGIGSGMIPITPTAAFPSPFLPPRWIPRPLNRPSHAFVNSMLWKAFRDKTNAARARYKLSARRQAWTGHPMVYGVSPQLVPRPGDWPTNAYLCGQWAPRGSVWSAPAPLTEFLASGEAPIYVGFGSMTGFGSTPLMQALVEAVGGRRALFYPGWSGVDGHGLPGNFLVIGETPHDWLFPRTAAVIHHGGSGTSHSVAGAGVPSVVVPFAADQYFWAERLRRLGVAPAPVDGRKPTAGAFARAIDFATSAQARARAQSLGEVMRADRGVADAVAALEQIVAR